MASYLATLATDSDQTYKLCQNVWKGYAHSYWKWQLLKRTRAEKNSRKPLWYPPFSYLLLWHPPFTKPLSRSYHPPMHPGVEESWGISNRSCGQVKIIFPPSVIRMDAAVPGKIIYIITEVCWTFTAIKHTTCAQFSAAIFSDKCWKFHFDRKT